MSCAESSISRPHFGIVEHMARAPRGTGWLFAGLFLLYMFDYIDREVISSLLPFLKKDLGITDTQAGSLASAVYLSIVCVHVSRLHPR